MSMPVADIEQLLRSSVPEALRSRIAALLDELPTMLAERIRAGSEADAWWRAWPTVCACSEFLAQNCRQRPDIIVDLIDSGELARPHSAGEIAARGQVALTGLADHAEDELSRRLRDWRRREMIRIAWRDLAGWADLEEVITGLSELADSALEIALTYLYRWDCARRGTPRGTDSGQPAQMVVLGFGKLGGQELNFSSDVDLMFAYTEDGETDAPQPLSNHEFFTRLGRRLIKIIGDATEHGFVFRVDMRLRPNGDSGPLVLSFDAMEHYYQTHGREWERYALIKARAVAGDPAAGADLLARLRPFIYRKYLDYGAINALREMKALINREVHRKGIPDNIKLGAGGIREVEFIAQTFQLIRGGREPALRSRRLREVLPALADMELMTADAVTTLLDAYEILRRVEHRVQMVADEQTQSLPNDELGQSRLAFAMGFAGWREFIASLRDSMQRVHEQFELVFVAPQRETPATGSDPLRDAWMGVLDTDTVRAVIRDAGYDAPDEVLARLENLRGGSAYRSFSTQGRERMDRLMPLLLAAAGLAQPSVATLQRVLNVVEAIGRRSVYLALLVENPMALSQLVKLCAASSWISTWISRHPVLLDDLLNPSHLYAPPTAEDLEDELRQWLARLPADDLEAQMDALREFRHSHVLRVAAADITGAMQAEDTAGHLVAIAETVLRHAHLIAHAGLVAKYGEPQAAAEGQPGFLIVGFGKLGSNELGYTSDLDVIFLFDDAAQGGSTAGERPIANEVFFARLVQRLLHILGAHTPAGRLYEVDMRLRPSGDSGPLVSSLSGFAGYQDEHAWTWEHQALVRARPVCGDPALAAAFAEVRERILCRARDPEELRREVAEMRAKMIASQAAHGPDEFDFKHDRGGMVDIEFIVQYFVLRWAAEHPRLIQNTDNVGILNALADIGALEYDWAAKLVEAYRHYLSAEHHLKLVERPPLVATTELVDEREQVTAIWQSIFA